jgi:E3 ubiquitin-protein ligase HERC4
VAVVAAGGSHVLAMTTDGELYTWGANSQSQLGLGKHLVRAMVPTHLQGAITGIKFVWAAAGLAHTLAVSRSGEVYCWGHNAQVWRERERERETAGATTRRYGERGRERGEIAN